MSDIKYSKSWDRHAQKWANFKRLRAARLPKAIKAIELLSHLSNRGNYHYEEEEAEQPVAAPSPQGGNFYAGFGPSPSHVAAGYAIRLRGTRQAQQAQAQTKVQLSRSSWQCLWYGLPSCGTNRPSSNPNRQTGQQKHSTCHVRSSAVISWPLSSLLQPGQHSAMGAVPAKPLLDKLL